MVEKVKKPISRQERVIGSSSALKSFLDLRDFNKQTWYEENLAVIVEPEVDMFLNVFGLDFGYISAMYASAFKPAFSGYFKDSKEDQTNVFKTLLVIGVQLGRMSDLKESDFSYFEQKLKKQLENFFEPAALSSCLNPEDPKSPKIFDAIIARVRLGIDIVRNPQFEVDLISQH